MKVVPIRSLSIKGCVEPCYKSMRVTSKPGRNVLQLEDEVRMRVQPICESVRSTMLENGSWS